MVENEYLKYEKQYFDLSHEAGFAGASNLLRVNHKGKFLENEAEKKRIYEWLSNQDSYTLHRPVKRRFPRLRYNVSNVDDVWEVDLLQTSNIKKYNDNCTFVLVTVDCLSKYAWVEVLKDKTGHSVTEAFKKILKRASPRRPVLVQSDAGAEFKNSIFQNYLKNLGINFRIARNPDIKCAVVERLNRTIRERMWRYFTYKNTKRYIDVIKKIIHTYNNSIHSGIKMRPVDVNFYNAKEARENLEKRARSQTINKGIKSKRAPGLKVKYNVGDYVRISRSKNTFEKGYEKNFSEEIFKVSRVSHRQGLFTYVLSDLNDEEIDGFFYTEELVLVGKNRLKEDKKFKIDHIVATKGRGSNKKVLVRWAGYNSKFDSWIKASELENI